MMDAQSASPLGYRRQLVGAAGGSQFPLWSAKISVRTRRKK
jgi:hypothetical protein